MTSVLTFLPRKRPWERSRQLDEITWESVLWSALALTHSNFVTIPSCREKWAGNMLESLCCGISGDAVSHPHTGFGPRIEFSDTCKAFLYMNVIGSHRASFMFLQPAGEGQLRHHVANEGTDKNKLCFISPGEAGTEMLGHTE
jgi:hypothetical protein